MFKHDGYYEQEKYPVGYYGHGTDPLRYDKHDKYHFRSSVISMLTQLAEKGALLFNMVAM